MSLLFLEKNLFPPVFRYEQMLAYKGSQGLKMALKVTNWLSIR